MIVTITLKTRARHVIMWGKHGLGEKLPGVRLMNCWSVVLLIMTKPNPDSFRKNISKPETEIHNGIIS